MTYWEKYGVCCSIIVIHEGAYLLKEKYRRYNNKVLFFMKLFKILENTNVHVLVS